tara:strand:- start:369 stop:791 length:423 start_codon:yes stop_codon:yes gene_type:complete
MLKKFFKKNEKKEKNEKEVAIAALLVHAAKIDENYTDVEEKIIKKALLNLNLSSEEKINALLASAKKKEKDSNQIIEYTKEIKKEPMKFRLEIIEILWKIIYADGLSDDFESNLIRRVCGLLYISDKDNGTIKLKVQNSI